MPNLECPQCHGAGSTQAGPTAVKDKKHGKIKTEPNIPTVSCTSCGGTGIYRCFYPA